eukprot:comp22124_c0_seq1/m.51599 comp22124_c0_seq1/g.51599  ORF comp22124_c0_seq1/g.51599 comp22124_c0_seq1/m.51599 type:complete len:317 (+) comp22124_c0_seq1:1107-2057(+)
MVARKERLVASRPLAHQPPHHVLQRQVAPAQKDLCAPPALVPQKQQVALHPPPHALLLQQGQLVPRPLLNPCLPQLPLAERAQQPVVDPRDQRSRPLGAPRRPLERTPAMDPWTRRTLVRQPAAPAHVLAPPLGPDRQVPQHCNERDPGPQDASPGTLQPRRARPHHPCRKRTPRRNPKESQGRNQEPARPEVRPVHKLVRPPLSAGQARCQLHHHRHPDRHSSLCPGIHGYPSGRQRHNGHRSVLSPARALQLAEAARCRPPRGRCRLCQLALSGRNPADRARPGPEPGAHAAAALGPLLLPGLLPDRTRRRRRQ